MSFLLTFSGGTSRTYKEAVRTASNSLENVNLAIAPAMIGGVNLNPKDRVLLTQQAIQSENGIYVFSSVGAPLVRATDANTSKEFTPGMLVPVAEGTSADKIFELATDGTITLGTTALNFQSVLLPIDLTTDVTGVLPVANGGTNRSSWTQGRVIFADVGGTALAEDSGLNWDNSNKRLGIGTSSPNAKLQVNNSGTQLGLSIYSTSSNNTAELYNQGTTSYTLALNSAANSAQTGASIGGYFARGTLSSRAQTLANDSLLSISASGHTGSAVAGISAAVVLAADQNTSASAYGGQIVFATTPNSTPSGFPIPRMYIKNDGKVNVPGLNASQLVATDISKNIQSLDIATYPSLTELSYVKGVTSSIQTQLDDKANKTLSNLNSPTAVNQDLKLNSEKVFVANGATQPSYTQGNGAQNEIITKMGVFASNNFGNNRVVSIATNAYSDSAIWKSRETGWRSLKLDSGSDLSGSYLTWSSGSANAGSAVTWTDQIKALINTDGWTNLTINGGITLKSVPSLSVQTDGTGSIGGYFYYSNRFKSLDIASRGSFGARKINSGTGDAAPAGVLSTYGKTTWTSREMVIPYPNSSNTVSYYDGNSGGVAEAGVGDYVKLSGLSDVRQITAINYSPLTVVLTLDGNVGDGTVRAVEISKPALLAFDNDNAIAFEVNNTGAVKLPKLTASQILTLNSSKVVTSSTGTSVTAMLDNFVGDSGSGGTKGLVPAPFAGDAVAGKFLKSDGTWAIPTGSGANVYLSNLSSPTAINQSLLFNPDNTYDIGADGTSRPAGIHAANHVTTPVLKGRDNVNGGGQHDITVRAGNGLTGNKDGGDLTLAGGLGVGTGVDGEIAVQVAGSEIARFEKESVLKLSGGLKVKSLHNQVGTLDIITVGLNDYYVGVDCSSAISGIRVDLPLASDAGAGKIYVIKDESGDATTNNISVYPSGTNKIDGLASAEVLAVDHESITLVCNGVDGWFII